MKRTTKYFLALLLIVGVMLVVANSHVREGFAGKPASLQAAYVSPAPLVYVRPQA